MWRTVCLSSLRCITSVRQIYLQSNQWKFAWINRSLTIGVKSSQKLSSRKNKSNSRNAMKSSSLDKSNDEIEEECEPRIPGEEAFKCDDDGVQCYEVDDGDYEGVNFDDKHIQRHLQDKYDDAKMQCEGEKMQCEDEKMQCENEKLKCENEKLKCENQKMKCEDEKMKCEDGAVKNDDGGVKNDAVEKGEIRRSWDEIEAEEDTPDYDPSSLPEDTINFDEDVEDPEIALPKVIAQSAIKTPELYLKIPARLSKATVDIIKSTAILIQDQGDAAIQLMYAKMTKDETIGHLFNPIHQVNSTSQMKVGQPTSMACCVHAYVALVKSIDQNKRAVTRIANKHVSMNVLPKHYVIMGKYMLDTVAKILGKTATSEVLMAWQQTYEYVAEVFIKAELDIREFKAQQKGGWENWRNFLVSKKVQESPEVISLHLEPKKKKDLLKFVPGSYVGVSVTTPDDVTMIRNYTLSCFAGKGNYRIVVKRQGALEDGHPPGKLSNWLHDHTKEDDVIQLSVPCGDFLLETNHKMPYVLVSGGVGITPLLSMLEYILQNKMKNRIFFLVVSPSIEHTAMNNLLTRYQHTYLNLTIKTIFNEAPDNYPKAPITIDHIKKVLGSTTLHKNDYYLCGPLKFTFNLMYGLNDCMVPNNQIKFEVMGPQE